MKKIGLYFSLLCGALSLSAINADAQCTGGRYLDSATFPNVTVTTVTYDNVHNQSMDIYQPTGDTYTKRPLMILAHGGSFISGNKTDDRTVTSLCQRFAKRGYVTASIDYRLAGPLDMFDSSKAIEEVIKALSDGKSAVRFFVKDARGANMYKIDTNNIFAGGNSAGAVLYMHLGYITDSTECPQYILDKMALHGGFEGESGNDIPGYRTKIKAVINLAGALNLTSFVNNNDCASVNAQGDADATVPYNCAHALSNNCPVTLCGMGVLEPIFNSKSVLHVTKIYPGEGHVPWSADHSEFDFVDSMGAEFLYSNFVCALGINDVKRPVKLSLYPNPARDAVNMDAEMDMGEIVMSDATGKVIQHISNLRTKNYKLNTANMVTGVYFVRIKFADSEHFSSLIRKIVVE